MYDSVVGACMRHEECLVRLVGACMRHDECLIRLVGACVRHEGALSLDFAELSAYQSCLNGTVFADATSVSTGPAATVPLLVQAFGGVAFVGVSGVGSCYLFFDQCNVSGNSANSTSATLQQVTGDGAPAIVSTKWAVGRLGMLNS